MNTKELKELLQKPYKDIGPDLFVNTFIKPIFGEDKFIDGYREPILDTNEELQTEAELIGIEKITKIGSVDFYLNPLDIFEIAVSDKVRMSRNRVTIQKLIRKIMDTHSSAFMIFHYSNEENWEWRFSYCNKGNGEDDITSAKRYTFLLGPGQSCRTAADNFSKLLNKSGDVRIEDIQEAFDVEALSKEFFARYKEQYEKFVKYLCDPSNGMREAFIKINKELMITNGNSDSEKEYDEEKPIRDYVKKLLGRIVFLHFLQKKGWMGGTSWENGDREFMWHLFESSSDAQKNDYLDLVLEPLFTSIDTDRSSNDFKFDTRVDLENGSEVRIPYLNGGLFERDYLDELDSKFPASYFEELLKFFREYNFTIDENGPDDAQVGVDPEMLGRIFENLLEDNKDKGAYYTPKLIVQFMCKESLYQYLEKEIKTAITKYRREKNELANLLDGLISEKTGLRVFVENYSISTSIQNKDIASLINRLLQEVKICDPAIGSGAFPLGILNEIFNCRRVLHNLIDPSSSFSNAEIKKEIIQNNIYGTDYEKGAVDIARLRFWLALIVDEIEPNSLPNLDFKIMQGNSLIESFAGQDLSNFKLNKVDLKNKTISLGLGLDEDSIVASLSKFIGKYYQTSDHHLKKQLTDDAMLLIKKLLIKKLDPLETNKDLQEKINNLKRENPDFFLWHIFFSDVFLQGGFDIVIGNPPYVQLQKDIGNSKKLGELYDSENYSVFDRTGDIYCLFFEKGFSLLKDKGILCFITSNKWMRSGYGELLRDYLSNKSNPIILMDFSGTKIFENANVDVNILLISKEKNKNKTLCLEVPKNDINNLNVLLQQTGTFCSFNQGKAPWLIMSQIEQSIKRKIEICGTPLKDWNIKIFRGVLTGLNKAFTINEKTREEILNNCKSEEEKKKTTEIIRPVLRGKDISKYGYNWENTYLIYLPWHFPFQFDDSIKGASKLAEDEFKKRFSSLYSYLSQFKDDLLKRNKAETGIRYEWYVMQRWGAKYWEVFDKPKIAWNRIGKNKNFSLVPASMMILDSMHFITGDHLDYICFLLNSKLYRWLLSVNIGDAAGGNAGNSDNVKLLPMPKYDEKILEKLKIFFDNQNWDKFEDSVYEIFGLSLKEREFIKQFNPE